MLPYPSVRPTGKTIGNRTEWALTEPFKIDMPLGLGRVAWRIEEGATTDFASVPGLLTVVISPVDPAIVTAALFHDDMYRCPAEHSVATRGSVMQTVPGKTSRFMADAIFRELMRLYGAPLWKRVLAYYAVRLFGGRAYQKG